MPTTNGKIYLGSVLLSGGASGTGWTRPADWLPEPTVANGEKAMRAIYGVENNATNYVALLATTSTGNYVVDWGDGTTDIVASNVQADHLYDYNDADLPAANAEGEKQVVVTVTAQTGNLTSINLQRRYNLAALNQAYDVNWLDIAVGGTTLTTITLGGTTVALAKVRRVFVNEHAVTTLASFCSGMRRLVDFEIVGSVASVTSMATMFSSCFSLMTIPAFTGSVASVTLMSNMFASCSSLTTIPAFPGSVSSVTTMASMFVNCSSLTNIPAFPGSVTALTNTNSMFSNCASLTTIPAFPSSTAAVTDMASMFSACGSLVSIPAFDTSGVSSSTNSANMFATCRSLAKGRTNGLRFAVTYNGDKLTATEINDIFTGLGTASGSQTITVTGNIGAATCDPTIATAKGWTVAV